MNDTALRQASPSALTPRVPPAAIQASAREAVVAAAAPARPLLWELLVTDGHVRAARLRRVQPWIIASALLCVWGGIWVARLAPALQPQTSVALRIQQRLTQIQAREALAFTVLSRAPLRPDQPDRLAPVSQIPEVVRALLGSLNDSGSLPDKSVKLGELDADAFWAGSWPTEQVSYVKSGATYLLGAYAHVGPSTSVQPVRWLGALKRINGKWQYASLGGAGTYVPPGLPSTSPQSISLSLEPFLPPLPKSGSSK
jgi:hypothetical protein